jgi:hypothetical protein
MFIAMDVLRCIQSGERESMGILCAVRRFYLSVVASRRIRQDAIDATGGTFLRIM